MNKNQSLNINKLLVVAACSFLLVLVVPHIINGYNIAGSAQEKAPQPVVELNNGGTIDISSESGIKQGTAIVYKEPAKGISAVYVYPTGNTVAFRDDGNPLYGTLKMR